MLVSYLVDCYLLVGYWLVGYWLVGYWLVGYWLVGYWLVGYWLVGYWLVGYWLVGYWLVCYSLLSHFYSFVSFTSQLSNFKSPASPRPLAHLHTWRSAAGPRPTFSLSLPGRSFRSWWFGRAPRQIPRTIHQRTACTVNPWSPPKQARPQMSPSRLRGLKSQILKSQVRNRRSVADVLTAPRNCLPAIGYQPSA